MTTRAAPTLPTRASVRQPVAVDSHPAVQRAKTETGHDWHVHPDDATAFGSHDPKHLAALVGAEPGDHLHFQVHPITGHHDVTAIGNSDGNRGKIVNVGIDPHAGAVHVNSVTAPGAGEKGWGSRWMLQSVQAARRLGMKSMHVENAAGDPGSLRYNGYYTWPRLGFDAPIMPGHTLPPEHADAKTFHELFDRPGGAEAWKKHGKQHFDLSFDLAPGSPHTKRLARYLKVVLAKRRMSGEPAKAERGDGEYFEKSHDGSVWTKRHPDGVEFHATTTPGTDGHWEVHFSRQAGGRLTASQTGDKAGLSAVPIMRAVFGSTKKFLDERSPKSFHFSAVKDEQSRVKLYDRAAPVIADQHGYEMSREDNGDIVHYLFSKKA